eukprot:759357-Hanusia_phi.AAC.1
MVKQRASSSWAAVPEKRKGFLPHNSLAKLSLPATDCRKRSHGRTGSDPLNISVMRSKLLASLSSLPSISSATRPPSCMQPKRSELLLTRHAGARQGREARRRGRGANENDEQRCASSSSSSSRRSKLSSQSPM